MVNVMECLEPKEERKWMINMLPKWFIYKNIGQKLSKHHADEGNIFNKLLHIYIPFSTVKNVNACCFNSISIARSSAVWKIEKGEYIRTTVRIIRTDSY